MIPACRQTITQIGIKSPTRIPLPLRKMDVFDDLQPLEVQPLAKYEMSVLDMSSVWPLVVQSITLMPGSAITKALQFRGFVTTTCASWSVYVTLQV